MVHHLAQHHHLCTFFLPLLIEKPVSSVVSKLGSQQKSRRVVVVTQQCCIQSKRQTLCKVDDSNLSYFVDLIPMNIEIKIKMLSKLLLVSSSNGNQQTCQTNFVPLQTILIYMCKFQFHQQTMALLMAKKKVERN